MRRRLVGVLIGLAAVGGLGAALAAGPDVAALRGELEARSLARDDARAQAQQLREDITRLDAQLAELRAVAATGAQGLAEKRARLGDLNQREAALRADMGANQSALTSLLGALELYRKDPPPALLVSPRSAQDAVRAAILVRAIEPELNARARAFRVKADELQRVRRGITGLSEDLFTSESALADGRAEIEQSIREKTSLEKSLETDAADAERRARSLSDALRSAGVSPQALARAEAGPAGPPIRLLAPAGGVVEYSGPLKGWGGVLILNVGGGYDLVLAGLDRITAATGRPVRTGQTLGAMAPGSGPELYLEIRRQGAPIDPARWFSPETLASNGRG